MHAYLHVGHYFTRLHCLLKESKIFTGDIKYDDVCLREILHYTRDDEEYCVSVISLQSTEVALRNLGRMKKYSTCVAFIKH